jgi:hypothetical protein
MSGAIPPLPNKPSWRGAQLKHRDNFTLNCNKTRVQRRNVGSDYQTAILGLVQSSVAPCVSGP